MRIRFCWKFQRYVSLQYCDFFNEGQRCTYYNPNSWNTLKELLDDDKRPEPVVAGILKPLQCSVLIDRDRLRRSARKPLPRQAS